MADEITTKDTGASDNLDAELKARFELLPADLQNVILNSDYATTLFNIAKANKLTYEQLESLQLETLMAFLGMNNPDEYRTFLQNAYKRTDAEMDVLIQAINEQVFDPVKDSLKKLYSEPEEDYEVEVESTTDAPVSQMQSTNNPFASVASAIPAYTESTATPIPIRTTPSAAPVPQQAEIKMQPIVPQATALTQNEKTVLGNAGVVLGESQNTAGVAPAPTAPMPSRNDVLAGIENPVKTPQSPIGTIMASKLSTSTTLMPNKTTDYSLPKAAPQPATPTQATTPTPPVTQSGDQYREKV